MARYAKALTVRLLGKPRQIAALYLHVYAE
jgi:hypothetical protein